MKKKKNIPLNLVCCINLKNISVFNLIYLEIESVQTIFYHKTYKYLYSGRQDMRLFFIYFLFLVFYCVSTFSHKVLINYVVSPQVGTENIQSWKGKVFKPHISTLQFEDTNNLIANNLGEFLLYMNTSLAEDVTAKAGRSFTGKYIQNFPSQHTGAMYYVLQGSESSSENLEKVQKEIQKKVLSYYTRKIGLLPTAQEAAFSLEAIDIKGFPHISLTKDIAPPPRAEQLFTTNPFRIIGYQVVYTFEFVDAEGTMIKIPQIFIEKWFEDLEFHIQTSRGFLFYNHPLGHRAALMHGNTHVTTNPTYLKINLNIVELFSQHVSQLPLPMPRPHPVKTKANNNDISEEGPLKIRK